MVWTCRSGIPFNISRASPQKYCTGSSWEIMGRPVGDGIILVSAIMVCLEQIEAVTRRSVGVSARRLDSSFGQRGCEQIRIQRLGAVNGLPGAVFGLLHATQQLPD